MGVMKLRFADINFSWMPHRGTALKDTVVNGIRIYFSERDPAARLRGEDEDEGKLLVAMYTWNSNSAPGNGYWLGTSIHQHRVCGCEEHPHVDRGGHSNRGHMERYRFSGTVRTSDHSILDGGNLGKDLGPHPHPSSDSTDHSHRGTFPEFSPVSRPGATRGNPVYETAKRGRQSHPPEFAPGKRTKGGGRFPGGI
eukprot:jgi/Psemu1/19594/gm1.19594_g